MSSPIVRYTLTPDQLGPVGALLKAPIEIEAEEIGTEIVLRVRPIRFDRTIRFDIAKTAKAAMGAVISKFFGGGS